MTKAFAFALLLLPLHASAQVFTWVGGSGPINDPIVEFMEDQNGWTITYTGPNSFHNGHFYNHVAPAPEPSPWLYWAGDEVFHTSTQGELEFWNNWDSSEVQSFGFDLGAGVYWAALTYEVPEPDATAGLLAGGVLLALAARRRKRA
jgi:hypothetical protein